MNKKCICNPGHPYKNLTCPIHGDIEKKNSIDEDVLSAMKEFQNKEIYALEKTDGLMGHSIFLAGPTPRNYETVSWRPVMIKILRDKGYTGNIFIPEKRGDHLSYEYETHTKWEEDHLNMASIILFWIPRELKLMPAFTTNIEFGEFMHSGKIILAYPKNAEKMRYLQVKAEMHNIPVFYNMEDAVDFILKST
jgi:hypothetical protein